MALCQHVTAKIRKGFIGWWVRGSGVTSHPQMIHKLDRSILRDIRHVVESGLHGWQRLVRFHAVMKFPAVEVAARELGIDQAAHPPTSQAGT